MRGLGGYNGVSKVGLVLVGVLLFGGRVEAQTTQRSTMPDAQIEANVLKALAGEPQVANENIITNTISGTVTLSGTVKDEPTRVMAETLASKANGVQKVVDELSIRTAVADSRGSLPASQRNELAHPAGEQGQEHAPDPDTYAAQHGLNNGAGESMPPDDSANNGQEPYGPPPNGSAPPQADPGYAGDGQPGNPQNQQAYPASSTYPRNPRNGYPDRQQNAPPAYGAQVAGQPVTVPSGAMLRIRINQGLDSKHSLPGTPFDAVVLNDVVADGAVAIPRGASVQGTVVDAKSGGAIKGRGELTLRLNQVTLGGKTFPITSDIWSRESMDKTGQTVGNAVGLGAVGAVIGAVAGGGPGAIVGAGVGGAAGVGSSAASGGRQVIVPSEAILTFHLTQPAPLITISQAEMDRLSYGVPMGASRPRMYRRYPPPPPPYYYGPAY